MTTPDHPLDGFGRRAAAFFGSPATVIAFVALVVLAFSWQFIVDASRAVPAFDTAFYQWRVEYLLTHEPGAMIDLRGATGALAGGYRIAQPLVGVLMRTVGGVGAATPTVVLSVLFRILCAVAMAGLAWRYRRSWLQFYLILSTIPALFLLQRFFGFMDNFLTLALVAGVLLLLEPMRTSWTARVMATLFMVLGGLSHPTTVAIFLLAMGAVAFYRLVRERSVAAVLRSEGPVLITGFVAVVLTAAVWLGGLWGPAAGFSDAAVPPPEDVQYFVNRSLSVLRNLTPLLLVPLALIGAAHLAGQAWRHRDRFAEVTLGWTLPLAGMFGFLLGYAYPYFRFYNATLAPPVLAATGLAVLVWWSARVRRRPLSHVLPAVALAAVVAVSGLWWTRGLDAWNATGTWLTPGVRETTGAVSGYLEGSPDDTTVVLLTDARPGRIVPYGKYKEFANAAYAGVDGEQIDNLVVFFGGVDDLRAGLPTTTEDQPYNEISAETAAEARVALDRPGTVVLLPEEFTVDSDNVERACAELQCVPLSEEAEVFALPDLSTTPVSPVAVASAREEAAAARAFAASPPGPLTGLGSSLLAALRLALLFFLPGYLLWRRLPERTWVEALALVPLFSIAITATVGAVALAVFRGPFTDAVGWGVLAVSVALPFVVGVVGPPVKRRVQAPVGRVSRDAGALFARRDFSFLMGAQWLAQAADGLVGVALAKLITFGAEAGLNPEAARTPREALVVVLLTFLPYSLFSPFVGVLIDRWDRRRLLIAANGLRVVVLAVVTALWVTRMGDAALYVSFLLILAGTRVVLAVKGAGLPAAVGERNLLQANSFSQAGSAVFQLGGAGVALVAAGFLDSRVIVAAGILVYALATLSATGARQLGYPRSVIPLRQEVARLVGDIVEGIREVARRAMAALGLVSFLVLRSMLTFVVLATVFISRDLIAEEGTLTSAIPAAAGGAGAVLGFLVAQGLKDRVAPARIVVGALVLGGGGMLAFGGVISIPGISLMAFAVGVSFFLGKISVDTLMQQHLADAFRGRGFSFQDVAYNLSWIVPAFLLFLFLTPARGRVVLLGGGVVFLALAALIALWARRARQEEPPPPAPAPVASAAE